MCNIDKVQAAQTKVARMITGSYWGKSKTSHRQTIFNKLNWPNVSQMVLVATTNLAKRASENETSKGINKAIIKKVPRSQRNGQAIRLRHTGPIRRKSNTFTSCAIEAFNSLPKELRDPKLTCLQFKEKMKEYSLTTKVLKEH